eukprot:194929-Pyramimonas_sp.AAC.1
MLWRLRWESWLRISRFIRVPFFASSLIVATVATVRRHFRRPTRSHMSVTFFVKALVELANCFMGELGRPSAIPRLVK